MLLAALGKVAVPTPGTQVVLSTISTGERFVKCVKFRTHASNTGKVYVGSPTMVRATLAGVMAQLIPPAATGQTDEFELCADEDLIDLQRVAVDADVAGEGPLVTLFTE